MKTKLCISCKQDTVLGEFNKYKTRKGEFRFKNECKTCQNIRQREHYRQNKARYKELRDKWRAENKELKKRYNDTWAKENKEKMKTYKTAFRNRNKAKRNSKHKQDMLTDSFYKTKHNIRTLLAHAFKKRSFKKTTKTAQILGCSFEELHIHLRQSFELNYGIPFNHINTKLLHIDHIIPLVSAKNVHDFIKLNHYSNLQYLFSWDNLEKGTKYVP